MTHRSRYSPLLGFNSRTPGGVRLDGREWEGKWFAVSIHAPREGCDVAVGIRDGRERAFQFTHPGRGATPKRRLLTGAQEVSIHAPREGCDTPRHFRCDQPQTFQFTHPGRGATRASLGYVVLKDGFQFTHPGRGATRA